MSSHHSAVESRGRLPAGLSCRLNSSAATVARNSIKYAALIVVAPATNTGSVYTGAARPAAAYAWSSASRSSVRCVRLIGVTPGVSTGSVQRNAGRPEHRSWSDHGLGADDAKVVDLSVGLDAAVRLHGDRGLDIDLASKRRAIADERLGPAEGRRSGPHARAQRRSRSDLAQVPDVASRSHPRTSPTQAFACTVASSPTVTPAAITDGSRSRAP